MGSWLLSMNFEGKCAIRLVHGLMKLELPRSIHQRSSNRSLRPSKNRGSMDPIRDNGVHGPDPRRGSMDQGSIFCTFPVVRTLF